MSALRKLLRLVLTVFIFILTLLLHPDITLGGLHGAAAL